MDQACYKSRCTHFHMGSASAAQQCSGLKAGMQQGPAARELNARWATVLAAPGATIGESKPYPTAWGKPLYLAPNTCLQTQESLDNGSACSYNSKPFAHAASNHNPTAARLRSSHPLLLICGAIIQVPEDDIEQRLWQVCPAALIC